MAYTVPKLSELVSRARAIFGLAEPADTLRVAPNVHDVVSKVLGLLSFEINQRIAWLLRQIFASSADEVWLRRHGYEIGVTQRAASKALGFASGTATNGTVFPSGLVFVRADGVRYATTSSAIATNGQVRFEIRAVDAGAAGYLAAGSSLVPESSIGISGFTGPLYVESGSLGGAADAEKVEDFRARILDRKRNPPHGGSKADWRRWALEVPGVTAAYVDTFAGDDREIWVAFLFEGRTNGIPNAGDVAVLQAYLEDPERRPVTARVTAVAPTTQALNLTLRIEPDSAELRARVILELNAMLADRVRPATPNANLVLYRAWIDEAISLAVGEDNHTLTAPAADIVITTPGAIPVLGSITWV